MRICSAMGVLILFHAVAVGQLSVAEQKLTEAEKSAQRLKFLNEAIQEFHILQSTTPPIIAKPPAIPAVRWINPQSGSRDGILSIFHAGGRPVCMAQLGIYSGGNAIHEFHVTSDSPFQLVQDDTVLWKSLAATIEFDVIAMSDAPRQSAVQRTVQMRRIAAEFEVWDDHGWSKTVRQKLRLLRQPIYRYSDAAKGVVDGAVFSFALANDPEAVLILEAKKRRTGSDGNTLFRQSQSMP